MTICTQNRLRLLGEIEETETRLNASGQIVAACWTELPGHYPYVELDEFVVMPNHVHAVVVLKDDSDVGDTVGAGFKPAPTRDGATRRHELSEVIRGFKTFSARGINALRETPGERVWQRNYYERVIRNEEELYAVRQYILDNPAKWQEDADNPANLTRV